MGLDCKYHLYLFFAVVDSIIPYLFFSTRREIRKIDLRHGYNYSIVLGGLQNTIGLDFDWLEQRLYYSDVSIDKIRRCSLDGSKCKNVVTTGLLMTEGKFRNGNCQFIQLFSQP